MAPPGPATAAPRLRFVDAFRGLAIVLMVVNHTARWWFAPSAGPERDVLIYVTMVLAGPTFLFLVGFSLALAFHRAGVRGDRPLATMLRISLRRAAVLLLAGFVLNALVFPQDVWGARVLHSIGLALVLATPLLPLARRPAGRSALLGLALALYVLFVSGLPALGEWSLAHPLAARLLLREFPPLPWLGLVLGGIVLGWHEAATPGEARRTRRYAAAGTAGMVTLAGYLLYDRATPLASRLQVSRDLVLNDYWAAAPVTAAGMVGALLCLLAALFWLVERRRWALSGLVTLGRAALLVYLVHLVIVVPVVREAGGLVLHDWWAFGAATAALIGLLLALAWTWLRLRPRLPWPRRLIPRPV